MNELGFIAALRAPRGPIPPHAWLSDDDCAVLEFGGETLVLTHDMMVAGVHFLPGQDPADVAWKLVATNLSDLAAKGAEPVGVLLGYMLGRGDDGFRSSRGSSEALAHYARAVARRRYGERRARRRTGARPDRVRAARRIIRCLPAAARKSAMLLYLTGPVGAAMIGFEALQATDTNDNSEAYRRPRALLRRRSERWRRMVTAMMDVSRTGCCSTPAAWARASGVTLAIDRAAVPMAAPEASVATMRMRWGDDYQLLFTAPASERNCRSPPGAIGEVLQRSRRRRCCSMACAPDA